MTLTDYLSEDFADYLMGLARRFSAIVWLVPMGSFLQPMLQPWPRRMDA